MSLEEADQSYAILMAEHRRQERTDRLLLVSAVITLALAFWLNQMWSGWWSPLLAAMSGLSIGTTLQGRRMRREIFKDLTRSYGELQRRAAAPLN